MRSWVALLVLVPLMGCGDRDQPDMDFGGEELGPDRHAMLSEHGDVKMGLSDRYVYLMLSDSVVSEARAEMRGDSAREGVGGMVSGVLEKAVGKALGFRAKLAIDDIEDIRWEDGAMRIVFTDPDRSIDFDIDDRPVEESFAEEDVREFGEAFRALKASRSR